MSLTLEEGREHIEKIVSAQEQWNIEEPAKPTGKYITLKTWKNLKRLLKRKISLFNKLLMKKWIYLVSIRRWTNLKRQ